MPWKWKKSDSLDCEHCKITENCQHFLFECSYVKYYWKYVVQSFNRIYKIELDLQWKHIVYGYYLEQKSLETLNLIIMVATFAAYKARVVNQRDIRRLLIEELTYLNYVKRNNILLEFINTL